MSPSKLIFYLCLSFLAGVSFTFFPYKALILIFFFISISVLSFLFVFQRRGLPLLLCLFAFLFGIFWTEKFESEISPQPEDIHFLNGKGEILFEGIILEEPKETFKNVKIVIGSQYIFQNHKKIPTKGKVLAILPLSFNFKYGDKILSKGKLITPKITPEGFNYKNYLKKDKIYSILFGPEIELISSGNGNKILSKIFSFKTRLKDISRNLSPPEGAILSGIVLGDESRFSKEFKEKLSLSGLSHITAVSGMNITILFGIIFPILILLGFWRKQATILTFIVLFFYILIVGAPPSAIRAGIMGGLFYLALVLGRLPHPSRVIIFAATAMVIFNPLILIYDIGFQLSFLAILGLLYLEPIFEKWLRAKDSLFLKLISQTLAAQIFCFPILIFNFGKFSIIAPISNVLVLPLLPFLTGVGFLFLVLGTFLPPLTLPLSFILYPFFAWITKVIDIFSTLPFSVISLNLPLSLLLIFYLILGFFLWFFIKKYEKREIQ